MIMSHRRVKHFIQDRHSIDQIYSFVFCGVYRNLERKIFKFHYKFHQSGIITGRNSGLGATLYLPSVIFYPLSLGRQERHLRRGCI